MPYCHRCGKSASENDDFCGHCGTKIKEFIEHAEQNIERAVKKNHRGFVVFILFLLIIGYVILDIWAMGQLKPVLSLDSIISSVSSLQGSTSLTSASASTTIRIENPTFIPVIAGRVVYDAGYGSTKVAEGEQSARWKSPEGFSFGIKQAKYKEPKYRFFSPGIHHFCFKAQSAKQVDELYSLLLKEKTRIYDKPQKYPEYTDKYYAVFFADPDGIKLELAYY